MRVGLTKLRTVEPKRNGLPLARDDQSAKDAKTRLQEWLQARRCDLPTYDVLNISGAAHAQTFDVLCHVPAFSVEGRGTGVTRRAAEQQAAELAFQQLESLPAPTGKKSSA